MAIQLFRDAKVWLDSLNMTGDTNRVGLELSADMADVTTLGATTRTRVGGLANATVVYAGFYDAATQNYDDGLFSRIGRADTSLVTVAPTGGAAGEIAYGMPAIAKTMVHESAIGEPMKVTMEAEPVAYGTYQGARLVRGTVMVSDASAVTATGSSAIRNLGAISSTQKLYAWAHCTAASGTAPTLDITVQSAATSGFASPTTRATLTQFTGGGARWITPVAGAITDAYWRVSYTLGGTAPSFTVVVVVGIL